jgi:hypothetical protein
MFLAHVAPSAESVKATPAQHLDYVGAEGDVLEHLLPPPTCLTTSCAFSRKNTGSGRPVRQPRAATTARRAATLCQLARWGSGRAAPTGKGALRSCRAILRGPGVVADCPQHIDRVLL